jgi:hypothetical protein
MERGSFAPLFYLYKGENMTRLELSLGDQFIWALVEPLGKEYIKSADEPGYQGLNLILSQDNPGPISIELEALPSWAKTQVLTAIKGGQLINTGDKISQVPVLKTKKDEELPGNKSEKSRSTNKRKKSPDEQL